MNKTVQTIKKLSLLVFMLPFFIVSCGSDDSSPTPNPNPTPTPPNPNPPTSSGDYENGVFVLNEGNSDPATASVTFISADGTTVEQDIFRAVNPNAEEIGTFLQNIFFDDDNAYIISGSANSVTIVNRYTFEHIATVSENLTNPRYGVVSEGKAFVTNGMDWSSGSVTVINLSDYSTSVIPFSSILTERIIEEDGKVYVSNGLFGVGNSVSVIDAKTSAVQTMINLGTDTPETIDEENGFLYVLTSSSGGSSSGGSSKIYKINTANNQTVSQKILHDSIVGPRHLTIEDDVIYFTNSSNQKGHVYSLPLNDFENNNINPSSVFSYDSNSLYGIMYGFAVENGKIYVADASNFSSGGNVYIYSLNGILQATHPAGIGPNGFYFND